jgi:hypothetical protein
VGGAVIDLLLLFAFALRLSVPFFSSLSSFFLLDVRYTWDRYSWAGPSRFVWGVREKNKSLKITPGVWAAALFVWYETICIV